MVYFNENTIVSLKISSSSKTKPFPLTVSLLYLSKIYKVQSRGSAGRWSNREWFTSVLLAAAGRTLLKTKIHFYYLAQVHRGYTGNTQ